MRKLLAALFVVAGVCLTGLSINPDYKAKYPGSLRFCLDYPYGVIMEPWMDGVWIEIPCEIWMRPELIQNFLDNCYYGYRGCIHREM